MARDTSAEFKKAWDEAQKIGGSPSNTELAKMYGLGKVARGAKWEEAGSRPGMFNPQGQYKWDGWQAVKDLTPEQAEKQYVDFIQEMKNKYGTKA